MPLLDINAGKAWEVNAAITYGVGARLDTRRFAPCLQDCWPGSRLGNGERKADLYQGGSSVGLEKRTAMTVDCVALDDKLTGRCVLGFFASKLRKLQRPSAICQNHLALVRKGLASGIQPMSRYRAVESGLSVLECPLMLQG